MPRFAANLSWLFTELPFLDRFAAAARAGFEAVECLFPYDHPAGDIRRRLDENGLALALFNAPPGDWAAGERGLAALPGAEDRFRESLGRALDYARVLRPERLHVMAGLATGAAARESYVANLAHAACAAGDLVLTIEPLNSRDVPGYHLGTSAAAVEVIEAAGAENLRLQLDLYHTQIMEGDLTRRIERLAPLLGHVQIAGVPDRGEPDRGETCLEHLMETLDRVGYEGRVGCEYRPAARTEDGLGWFAPWRRAREGET